MYELRESAIEGLRKSCIVVNNAAKDTKGARATGIMQFAADGSGWIKTRANDDVQHIKGMVYLHVPTSAVVCTGIGDKPKGIPTSWRDMTEYDAEVILGWRTNTQQSTNSAPTQKKPSNYQFNIPEGSEEYRFVKAIERNICTGNSIINDPIVFKVLKDSHLADSGIERLGNQGYEEFLYQWAIGSFKYRYPYGDFYAGKSLINIKQQYCNAVNWSNGEDPFGTGLNHGGYTSRLYGGQGLGGDSNITQTSVNTKQNGLVPSLSPQMNGYVSCTDLNVEVPITIENRFSSTPSTNNIVITTTFKSTISRYQALDHTYNFICKNGDYCKGRFDNDSNNGYIYFDDNLIELLVEDSGQSCRYRSI
jgi:hypothetical protein